MDSDGVSIASASSEELEILELEDFCEEVLDPVFCRDFHRLFQSEEDPSLGQDKTSQFTPLEKNEIPQHLHSIIDACNIILG